MLELACAADRRYLGHSAAMIDSVLAHRGELACRIHFLHGPQLPVAAIERLAEMVAERGGTLQPIEIADERIAGLPTMTEISSAMWYRIYLAELLPDVAKVLYLDVDTLAMRSLAGLWEIELGDSYVGAVTNIFQADHFGRLEHLGLSGPEVYFNSGVLLMNLEALRRDRFADTLRAYALANVERLDWPDQDALNVVLGGRRLPLHPRFNVMNSTLLFESAADVYGAEALAEARREPVIRHFEGPAHSKPWHLLCDRPHRELYFEHRRRTPWPRVRREGVTAANLARLARRRISS